MRMKKLMSVKEAAHEVGVSPITLKRWLLSGKVKEVARNRNDWRVFTEEDVLRIKKFAHKLNRP